MLAEPVTITVNQLVSFTSYLLSEGTPPQSFIHSYLSRANVLVLLQVNSIVASEASNRRSLASSNGS